MGAEYFVDDESLVVDLLGKHFQVFEEVQEFIGLGDVGVGGEGSGEELHD